MENVMIFAGFPPNETVGGTALSASQLALSLAASGKKVYLMIKADLPALKDLPASVTVIDDVLAHKVKGYWSKGKKISRLIRQLNIGLIITFDKINGYHTSFPAALHKVPVVPILPGGSGDAARYPFFRTPKLIAFSEENKAMMIQRWKYQGDNVIVKQGRFIFEDASLSDYTVGKTFRIAYISGLREVKLKAYEYFLDELKKIPATAPLHIDIVGDGRDKTIFAEKLQQSGLTNVTLAGFMKVDFNTLSQYNLVVTMGRGVVEAAALRLPVAICGENGYKGLLTAGNLPTFEGTNMTGRGVAFNGNLDTDIQQLSSQGFGYTANLANDIRDKYDVNGLKQEILSVASSCNMVPGGGSLSKTLFLNLRVFLRMP